MARSRRTPELIRIGAAIKDRREQRGETQKQVAENAGISQWHYSDIELGHRASRRTYLLVADALDITVEDMDELTGQEVNV